MIRGGRAAKWVESLHAFDDFDENEEMKGGIRTGKWLASD